MSLSVKCLIFTQTWRGVMYIVISGSYFRSWGLCPQVRGSMAGVDSDLHLSSDTLTSWARALLWLRLSFISYVNKVLVSPHSNCVRHFSLWPNVFGNCKLAFIWPRVKSADVSWSWGHVTGAGTDQVHTQPVRHFPQMNEFKMQPFQSWDTFCYMPQS